VTTMPSTILENLRYDVYTLNLLATIKPVDLLFSVVLTDFRIGIATVDCSSRPTFVVVDGALGCDLLPNALVLPFLKVAIHHCVRREVMGQHH